jgi:16S rRNA (cytosine1402-N4)-methyltransferase
MDEQGKLKAGDIVNGYGEKDLKKIFEEYGEERYAGRIAKAIVGTRKGKHIDTTLQIVSIIEEAVPEKYKTGRIHCATKVFQALRIEVNREYENLKKFLSEAIEILAKKGRLAVISFHSGEDRIVKQILRENARGCICPPEFPICQCGKKPQLKIINQKPIVPGTQEISANPRARSAKLRVAEKI